MDEKITSRENAKIKYACRLSSSAAFRRSEGRFLAEGRKLCPELARSAQLETLFYTESAMAKCPELAGLPGEHYLVEDHVADKLADVGTHQGVFGVFRTPVHTLDEVKAGGRYLALERVQDPGNVGTLLRSAAAFGFDGVILSDGCASVYAPKTLRASMGAAVRIPVIEAGAMPDAITQLRAKGITCLAAALYKSQPLSAAQASCPGGVCVVIGSEGQGLTDETIADLQQHGAHPHDRPGGKPERRHCGQHSAVAFPGGKPMSGLAGQTSLFPAGACPGPAAVLAVAGPCAWPGQRSRGPCAGCLWRCTGSMGSAGHR